MEPNYGLGCSPPIKIYSFDLIFFHLLMQITITSTSDPQDIELPATQGYTLGTDPDSRPDGNKENNSDGNPANQDESRNGNWKKKYQKDYWNNYRIC